MFQLYCNVSDASNNGPSMLPCSTLFVFDSKSDFSINSDYLHSTSKVAPKAFCKCTASTSIFTLRWGQFVVGVFHNFFKKFKAKV